MTDITPPSRTPNPLTWFLVVGLLLWSLFITLVVQGSTLWLAWMTDLSTTEESAQSYLAGGLWLLPLLLVPALLLLLLKEPRQVAVVRTLLLAILAAGLLLIPRILFPPEAIYLAGWTRAATGIILGLALLVWSVRNGRVRRTPGRGLGLGIIIGLLFLTPWLLYGALGDGFDVLTALFQAFGLALLAAGLAAYLMPSIAKASDNPLNNIWLGGITLAVALVVIAGAWGQMDYQALLIGILPGLGFPLALFGIDEDRYDVISAVLMVTIATLGPLAFADPQETRLVALLSGETAVWSFRATTINFLTGWILTLVLGLSNIRLMRGRLSKHWLKLAAVVFVAAVGLHSLAGQPGFFGDSLFVVLKDQADLSPASAIEDVDARRAWVYETLTEQADATQPDLLSWLDQRGIPYRRYYLVNGVDVQANAIRRWQLSRHPAVERVVYNPRLRPIPELPAMDSGMASKPEEIPWGIGAIGAPRVWSELGVTGEGVVIGQSDSGVDASHSALAAAYRGNSAGDDYNWFDPWYGKPTPYDINGHGTHTLGTALGQEGIGVAPGASWFACANLVRAFGNTSHYLDCMQFMLAPHPAAGDPLHDGRPDLAADISTNSWGCPPSLEGCDQMTLWQAAAALRQAGILFVAAAGNEGPGCNSLETPPGNYDIVFSVGAIDSTGDLAEFSSRGPDTQSPDASSAPELLAPGVDVLSAWPGEQWEFAPGTSMATPHVAGVAALMWSANPALRGDIDATERILIETARPYLGVDDGCGFPNEDPDSGAGYGIVDAFAAVQQALVYP